MNDTMKIDAAVLAEEVAWLMKGKSGSSFGSPVLHAAHLSTSVGGLQLRRTDYALFRETVVPADGGTEAVVLLDPTTLGSLLKGASGYATLDVTDTGVTIGVGARRIKLRKAADVDEYPDWPQFQPGPEDPAVVGAQQLARALTSVGTDDTLPMLTGVRFDGGVMASTDRFRLTCITYAERGFRALLPSEALRPFSSGTDVVRVEHGTLARDDARNDGEAVQLSSGGRSVIAHVLDAEFPKFRQLIPTELPVVATLRRAELIAAIDRDEVSLTLHANGFMTVRSTDRHGGIEVEQDISAMVLLGDELPFTVKFNTQNLLGCLKGISAAVVKFAASAPARPVVLTSPGDGDLHLVMPIRMPDAQAAPAEDAEAAPGE